MYELLPYFLVHTPDECGRQDGIGNFYRIYNWYVVQEGDFGPEGERVGGEIRGERVAGKR